MNVVKTLILTIATIAIIAPMSVAQQKGEETNLRKPKDDVDLRYWLENMTWHHNFTKPEIIAATGLSAQEIDTALKKFKISAATK